MRAFVVLLTGLGLVAAGGSLVWTTSTYWLGLAAILIGAGLGLIASVLRDPAA